MLLMSNISEQNKLIQTIDHLREEMIQTGLKEGLTSEKTITLSQKLDDYITRYQTIQQNIYR